MESEELQKLIDEWECEEGMLSLQQLYQLIDGLIAERKEAERK